jgi:RNA polymerase sigma factor for flagellar operon FliA
VGIGGKPGCLTRQQIADGEIERWRPWVLHLARGLQRRLPAGVAVDELAAAGLVGLWQAILAFDPGRGIALRTFATRRISGAMLDWVRSIDPLTRNHRAKEKAGEVGPIRFHSVEARAGAWQMQDGREMRRGTELPDERPDADPGRRIESQEAFAALLAPLRARERLVMTMLYVEGRTMKQAARTLECSESWISIRHDAAIKVLRKWWKAESG